MYLFTIQTVLLWLIFYTLNNFASLKSYFNSIPSLCFYARMTCWLCVNLHWSCSLRLNTDVILVGYSYLRLRLHFNLLADCSLNVSVMDFSNNVSKDNLDAI